MNELQGDESEWEREREYVLWHYLRANRHNVFKMAGTKTGRLSVKAIQKYVNNWGLSTVQLDALLNAGDHPKKCGSLHDAIDRLNSFTHFHDWGWTVTIPPEVIHQTINERYPR